MSQRKRLPILGEVLLDRQRDCREIATQRNGCRSLMNEPGLLIQAHAADDIVIAEIENWRAVFGGKSITVPV